MDVSFNRPSRIAERSPVSLMWVCGIAFAARFVALNILLQCQRLHYVYRQSIKYAEQKKLCLAGFQYALVQFLFNARS